MCYIQLSLLGCAGYVVIGNTLTEPQVGSVLLGEDSSRCRFTPMYFHEVWSTRRAIDQARRMFHAVATVPPEAAAASPIASIPEAAASESAPEPVVEEPEAQDQPTFTVSAKKKNAGQIMLDL